MSEEDDPNEAASGHENNAVQSNNNGQEIDYESIW